jgi:hypothetical protein
MRDTLIERLTAGRGARMKVGFFKMLTAGAST